MLDIGCDFPGGNILVDGIEGGLVRLRQDQRDTRAQSWFYWHFGVRGGAGRVLRFEFAEEVVGVRGPGVSLDRGATWQWLGAGDRRSFTYAFPSGVEEVRFSFGMPYTQAHLERFLAAHADPEHLQVGVLCQSGKGRPVELLRCGRLDGRAKHRVLFTARHHCCEMMASYELEGVLAAVLAEDETGRWLRDHVEVLAVPFMDKDGVEAGDQGKARDPHDHNRDYATGLYPEVRALKEQAGNWAETGLDCMFDLHCPGPRGEWHELVYFVGLEQAEAWRRTEAFCRVLESANRSPLPYRVENNLPFGVGWNTAADGDPPEAEPRSAARWFSQLPGVRFGASLEMPYANAQGAEVNAPSARAFGQALAGSLVGHLSGPL